MLDDEDRVLLVGQHRYTLDAYSWEIPEGGVPDGESAVDGARRELREETGVEADELAASSAGSTSRTRSPTRPACSSRRVPGATARPRRIRPRSSRSRWVPFDAALAMIAMGEITDAMTIMGLQAVALERATRAAGQRGGDR